MLADHVEVVNCTTHFEKIYIDDDTIWEQSVVDSISSGLDLALYVDGSVVGCERNAKIKGGAKSIAGASAILYDVKTRLVISAGQFPAGLDRTSYDAEGHALDKGALLVNDFLALNNLKGLRIGIFTDSKSWVTKLGNLKPGDDFEVSVFDKLNTLAADNKVTIRHVKSHVGILGNES